MYGNNVNNLAIGNNVMVENNINWFDDKIKKLPKNNWLYKFTCFFLCKKKLKYKEMYLILQRLNSHHGEEKAKQIAIAEIINIYNFNKQK